MRWLGQKTRSTPTLSRDIQGDVTIHEREASFLAVGESTRSRLCAPWSWHEIRANRPGLEKRITIFRGGFAYVSRGDSDQTVRGKNKGMISIQIHLQGVTVACVLEVGHVVYTSDGRRENRRAYIEPCACPTRLRCSGGGVRGPRDSH